MLLFSRTDSYLFLQNLPLEEWLLFLATCLLNEAGKETSPPPSLQWTGVTATTRCPVLLLLKEMHFPYSLPNSWAGSEGGSHIHHHTTYFRYTNAVTLRERSRRRIAALAKQLNCGFFFSPGLTTYIMPFCFTCLPSSPPSLVEGNKEYFRSFQKVREGICLNTERLLFQDDFQHDILFMSCQKKHFIVFSLVKGL